jgi:hypothetical protein
MKKRRRALAANIRKERFLILPIPLARCVSKS